MGGYASVHNMSGDVGSSTTLRAAVSASSMCVIPACDFNLPIYVLYPDLSFPRMVLSASFLQVPMWVKSESEWA